MFSLDVLFSVIQKIHIEHVSWHYTGNKQHNSNFYQLLLLRSRDNPKMSHCLKKKLFKYISSVIFNWVSSNLIEWFICLRLERSVFLKIFEKIFFFFDILIPFEKIFPKNIYFFRNYYCYKRGWSSAHTFTSNNNTCSIVSKMNEHSLLILINTSYIIYY